MNNRGNTSLVLVSLLSPGPPIINISSHSLSELVDEIVNVTISWTLSGKDSADFYLINITNNAPQSLHGGLLNITTGDVTQHELTGFMTGYKYNITVRGVTASCGGLVGRESEPLPITPQSKYTCEKRIHLYTVKHVPDTTFIYLTTKRKPYP